MFGYVASCDRDWDGMACPAHTTIRPLVPSRALTDGVMLPGEMAAAGWVLRLVDDRIDVTCPAHAREAAS